MRTFTFPPDTPSPARSYPRGSSSPHPHDLLPRESPPASIRPPRPQDPDRERRVPVIPKRARRDGETRHATLELPESQDGHLLG